MAYPSLAMLRELLDATNRDLKGSGRLHRHPREVPRRKATLNPISEMAGHRLERQSRGNLYGAFIEQNVDASRNLIVESAFEQPDPGPESGRFRAGTTRGYGYPGFWVDLICIKAARLGVHSKAQGLEDLLR